MMRLKFRQKAKTGNRLIWVISVLLALAIIGMPLVQAAHALDCPAGYIKFSGYVKTGSGTGIQGVELQGLDGNPVTDASGYYETCLPSGWSGTVMPVLNGYDFTPISQTYRALTGNQTGQNYFDTKAYVISGYVRDKEGNGLKNVNMGGLNVYTDADGFYTANVVSGWSGRVMPNSLLYSFEPLKTDYENVNSDFSEQNYTASLPGYTITGYVRDKDGNGVPGVVIEVEDMATNAKDKTRRTDWRGFYRVKVDFLQSVILRPSKPGYSFTPSSMDYEDTEESYTDQNFRAKTGSGTDCSVSPDKNQSKTSGNWSNPYIWTQLHVPSPNDEVQINKGDVVTVDQAVQVKNICNFGKLQGVAGSNLTFAATDFLYNSGEIIGADGVGKRQKGSDILIGAMAVHNIGTIKAGNGAADYSHHAAGGQGGTLMINGDNITNEGNVSGGNGGYAKGGKGGSAYGGYGGYTMLLAKKILKNNAGATVAAGAGGGAKASRDKHCKRRWYGKKKCWYTGGDHRGGDTGDTTYSGSVAINRGTITGKKVTLDPSSLEIIGPDAQIIAEDEIVITGGAETTVYLADLIDGAISAPGNITIELGPGSTLDMRGLTEKAIQAEGKIQIFADKIITDNGEITDVSELAASGLLEAEEITLEAGKVRYEVILAGPKQIFGQPGETVTISFNVVNHSSVADTYTLTATDADGWSLGALTATDAEDGSLNPLTGPVALDSLASQNLSLTVTLPSEEGAEDTVTVTARSVNHPDTVENLDIKVLHQVTISEEEATDEDEDGLPKFEEEKLGTDPANPDTDGDGMDDWWEAHFSLNPLADDSAEDKDNDGYTNIQEYDADTDPTVADTDGDGLNDSTDNCPFLANPDQADGDNDGMGDTCDPDVDNDSDGMADVWERWYDLNPAENDADADPDGDGYSNIREYEADTVPTDPEDYPDDSAPADTDGDGVTDDQDAFPNDPDEQTDTDGDGIGNNADTDDDNDTMPDEWEITHGLNPLADDASEDKDSDSFSNLQEYEAQTDPADSNSKPVTTPMIPPEILVLDPATGNDVSSYMADTIGNPEVHIISVSQTEFNLNENHPRRDAYVRVTRKQGNPMILVLSSGQPLTWHIEKDPGVNIQKIILNGQYAHEIQGADGIEILNHSGDDFIVPGQSAHEWNAPRTNLLIEDVEKITGVPLTSFNGCYQASQFIIRDRGDNGSVADNSVVVTGHGDHMMIVTPDTDAEEKEMTISHEPDGSVVGDNGTYKITTLPYDDDTNDYFTFTVGKNLTDTGEAQAVRVNPAGDGSYVVTSLKAPNTEFTVRPDGSYTAVDTEHPGTVITGSDDSSYTVTDAEFPGMSLMNSASGVQKVMDTLFPGMEAVINANGTYTVTDAEYPGAVAVYNPEDGSFRITDDAQPGTVITFFEDGSYIATDEDGNCFVPHKRGFFSSIKKLFNKVGKFVKKVANFVQKIASFVQKVATLVSEIFKAVQVVTGIIGTFFPPFAVISCYAGMIGNGAAAVAGYAGQVADAAEKVEKGADTVIHETERQKRSGTKSSFGFTIPEDCTLYYLYTASGVVRDNDDNPVPGATVQIDDVTVTADADGYWEIIAFDEGTYTATASMDGYEFDPVEFEVTDDDVEVEIVPHQDEAGFTDGDLFVSSCIKDEIRIYDAETLEFKSAFTHELFSNHPYGPNGIAFNKKGNLVVSAYAHFVEFSAPGVEVARYPKHIVEANEHIKFDDLGNLYTTTSTGGSDQLIKYRASDYSFEQVITLPAGAGSLTGIIFDTRKRLFVASQEDRNIYVMQANDDFSEFEVSHSISVSALAYPEGIAINQNGELLVLNGNFHNYDPNIHRYDPNTGQLLGSFDTTPDTNIWPHAINIDNQGRIYVADFEYDGSAWGAQPADLMRFAPDGSSFVLNNNTQIYGPFDVAVAGTQLKPPQYTAGVFTVTDKEGKVKVDYLFDGGLYEGELGIFSLEGMDAYEPGSPDFIAEAIRRVMSDSEDGYIVVRDAAEGARFSGQLGSRQEDEFNEGEYIGLKTVTMRPGDRFATVLIPDGTFADVAQNPGTSDPKKRPLFSLATANPDDGLYYGQIAGISVDDMEEALMNAIAYEDIAADNSDRDYNDIVVQIRGVAIHSPTLDGLIAEGYMQAEDDWRVTDNPVVPHIVVPEPDENTQWITVTLKSPADLLVYDPDGNVIGKDGGSIPGATFEWDENGHQVVTLPALEDGDYNIVLRAIGDGGLCHLEVQGFRGGEMLESREVPLTIEPHQVLRTTLPVTAFIDQQQITFDQPKEPVAPDGTPLAFDFNGDSAIDDFDIQRIADMWGAEEGDADYDPFYDFDDDGRIGFYDIMSVSNSYHAQ
ncbi:hypothetical protein DENIS_0579 [Desulfonema ishimotonii]|uniref:DUF4114 domain-containing protein n=1 Tax=Desulfonema ishimotonii TaxID=45657 RepID=A0A401FRR3_9BACT|nr:carboxypeptidase regulatory-like domain-containing protein [Desulfonema ishimotonii]GBC59640.1 hypothetical protein DENIS_0579 [Desulfonema ishimotonii]